MFEDDLRHLDTSRYRQISIMKQSRNRVRELLEKSYMLDLNSVEKILDAYYDPGFLPAWYFHSNNAEEIAKHIFVITQLLNARTETLRQESDDGKVITYFSNVGRETACT